MADNYATLKDTIIPAVFANYVSNLSTKTNRLINSGILTPDPSLGSQLMAPGDFITLPFVNDIADADDAQSWADTQDIEVEGLTTGSQRAFKFRQAKSFGYTDISQLVSGAPLREMIANRFGAYWNFQDQKLLIDILAGVFSNTDIHTAKAFDDTTTFGPRGFLAAVGRLGDLQDQTFNKIMVNSATYSEMKSQQMIDTIQPSEAVKPFGTYNGMEIVVDDDLPIDENGVATSYIFGNGSVGYSTATPSNAVEIERLPRKNGGQTAVINRRIVTTHVLGTSVAKSFTPAGQTVTPQELATGSTWESIVDPRNIKIVQYNAKLDKEFIPEKVKKSNTSGTNAPASTATSSTTQGK